MLMRSLALGGRLALYGLGRRANLALALALVATAVAAGTAEAGTARVSADGDCLNLRATAGLGGAKIACIADGTTLTTLDGDTATVDGLVWQRVRLAETLDRGGSATGWVASIYLVQPAQIAPVLGSAAPLPAPTAPPAAPPSPALATARPFEAPPPGGITIGVAGTASIAALVAAQPFPVAAVAALDPATQRYLSYITGAPASVQTLTDATLRPESVVILTRASAPASAPTSLGGSPPLPGTALATAGAPRRLPAPPRGGLTQGQAGTGELAALIAAQPFAVELVMTLDVPTQRWLMHIPGGPDAANTLGGRALRPETIVTLRRSATLPDPPAPAIATASAAAEVATITYYYCTPGSRGIGDGGGFCGGTASGVTVHAGTASCGRGVMGQRFRIVGDPTARTYVCEDTGGGVGAAHRDIWFATSDEGYDWWRQTAPGGTARIEVVP